MSLVYPFSLRLRALPFALAVFLVVSGAFAQPAPAPSASEHAPASAPSAPKPSISKEITAPPAPTNQIIGEDGDETAAFAPDSPRASVKAYLSACKDGNFEAAADYLELPPGADGPKLAMRLKAALDRYSWVDLELVSPLSLGNPDDKLPLGVDEIGKIPVGRGKFEAVRIVRRQKPEGVRWMFSRRTVERVDVWYGNLRDRWFLEHLPPSMLRPGPWDLLMWQWLVLPLLVAGGWLFGRVMGRISQFVLKRLTRRTAAAWDDELVGRLVRPLRALWALLAVFLAMPFLGLYEPAEDILSKVVRALGFGVILWGLLRVVDVFAEAAHKRWELAKDMQAMRALVLVARSVAKVFLMAGAIVIVLAEFGYPATSLITGLGIGGVVLALAAQKTVENLFGSISIGIDKPLRVGDFVKVDEVLGTVELIGLRSTRIRTLSRTVVTIPNGRMADMRIESYTLRDKIWLSAVIGVEYGTSAAQLKQVLEGIEKVLMDHPKIWSEKVIVRFAEFGSSSLNIQVMAWFMTTEYDEFMVIRQEVLLGFMRVVEEAGTSFAFPTQTVHLIPEKNKEAKPSN